MAAAIGSWLSICRHCRDCKRSDLASVPAQYIIIPAAMSMGKAIVGRPR